MSTRRTFLAGALAAATPPAAVAANDKVRVGVIGCGARSHELMRHLLTAGGAEITTVCDAYQGTWSGPLTAWAARRAR